MVFELMDRNLYEWIKDRKHYLPESRVKPHIYQILKVLDHIHRTGVFHRDIKPENILLREDTIKLADFGSCRGTISKQPYTEYISTRWYRSPECLLTDGYYDFKMDIWGVGCIFFEVLALRPLFPGKNELDQVNQIHTVLGTPPLSLLNEFQRHATHMEFNFPLISGTGIDILIPHVTADCRNLISRMLMYDSTYRPTAKALLKSSYFKELRDQDAFVAETPVLRPVHFRVSPTNEGDGDENYAKTIAGVPSKAAEIQLPAIKNAYNQKFKLRKNGAEVKFGNRQVDAKGTIGKKGEQKRTFPSPVRRGFYKSYI